MRPNVEEDHEVVAAELTFHTDLYNRTKAVWALSAVIHFQRRMRKFRAIKLDGRKHKTLESLLELRKEKLRSMGLEEEDE